MKTNEINGDMAMENHEDYTTMLENEILTNGLRYLTMLIKDRESNPNAGMVLGPVRPNSSIGSEYK